MEIVVNEWLLEWLRPDHADAEQRKFAQQFLVRLLKSERVLVVRNPSAFYRKAHRYPKEFSGYPTEVQFYRHLINLIQDSDRCRIVDDEDALPLPESTLKKLAVGNFGSDRYLFEAAHTTAPRIIVTSDEKLIAHLAGEDFRLVLPGDFTW